jgi:tRNA A-37 threonylcarbamoyl transferase component Bud32
MEAAGGAGGPSDDAGPLYSITWEGGKFVKREKEPSTFKFEDGTSFHKYIQSASFKSKASNSFGTFSDIYKVDDKYIIKNIFKRSATDYYRRNNDSYNSTVADEEIAALITLHESPYVVKLLAAETYNHEAFLLYPLVPGNTVGQWLWGNPDKEEKERVISELEAGLDDIHKRGRLHGDIHFFNAWIPTDGSPAFFIDFGKSEEIKEGNTKTNLPQFEDLSKYIREYVWVEPAAPAGDGGGRTPPYRGTPPYGGVRRTRRRRGPARNRTRGQKKQAATARRQKGRGW